MLRIDADKVTLHGGGLVVTTSRREVFVIVVEPFLLYADVRVNRRYHQLLVLQGTLPGNRKNKVVTDLILEPQSIEWGEE